MSEVYIKEPATKGKVILRTTHGDLEIELWSTEAPKACRNFCQLVLEGYYNGCIFHRVIKDFCMQGGDPTGTGDECTSIYGKPYPDEIHPRLKFRYRGMVGVASAGRGTKTNGSQFFIVLNRAPSLDGKHTLFAKVVGQTVYNLVRLSEVEVDKNDRPVDPPRILRAELVWDPFDDLEPRVRAPPPLQASLSNKEEHRRIAVKNKNVLSFTGGDDDESDNEVPVARSAGKSAHDLLSDPKLLRGEVALARPAKNVDAEDRPKDHSVGSDKKLPGRAKLGAPKEASMAKKISKKVVSGSEDDSEDRCESGDESDNDVAMQQATKRQQEILRLKRSIAGLDAPDEAVDQTQKKPTSALDEQRVGYATRTKRDIAGKDGRRRAAANVMSSLKDFQDRLRKQVDVMDQAEEDAASGEHDEDRVKEKKSKKEKKDKKKEKKERADKPGEGEARTEKRARLEADSKKSAPEQAGQKPEEGTFAAIWQEGEEESDANWLAGGGLKFHASGDKAFKMAAMKARENLEIFDPLAAKGNAEVLADARKKRSEQLRPTLRRPNEIQKW